MLNFFPQQNFADWLKATAYRGTTPDERKRTLAVIQRLESAQIWQPAVFAQAIEQVRPGAIWSDGEHNIHINGGVATLEQIADKYFELTGERVAVL